jgi:hypothetical protein
MSNLCIYIILALLLYCIFYRNKESMDDTGSGLKDKLFKKNRNKKKESIKNIMKEKLKLSHRSNLNLIKEVTKISKQLDDGMREINSW